MTRCEGAWKQVLWLWEKSWPDVDGMGEEDEVATAERFGNGTRPRGDAGAAAAGAPTDRDAERADDDDDDDDLDVMEVSRRESGIGGSPSYVSPYGGTGLQAVEAANHA